MINQELKEMSSDPDIIEAEQVLAQAKKRKQSSKKFADQLNEIIQK